MGYNLRKRGAPSKTIEKNKRLKPESGKPSPKDNIKCIVLDIEGTTCPITFVSRILFPFASKHVGQFLKDTWETEETMKDVEGLQVVHKEVLSESPPALDKSSPKSLRESSVRFVQWLISKDKKVTPLKSLQGRIWKGGFASGELVAELFEDVEPELRKWKKKRFQALYLFKRECAGTKVAFRAYPYRRFNSFV
eukprot:Rmarinus@m.10184